MFPPEEKNKKSMPCNSTFRPMFSEFSYLSPVYAYKNQCTTVPTRPPY